MEYEFYVNKDDKVQKSGFFLNFLILKEKKVLEELHFVFS